MAFSPSCLIITGPAESQRSWSSFSPSPCELFNAMVAREVYSHFTSPVFLAASSKKTNTLACSCSKFSYSIPKKHKHEGVSIQKHWKSVGKRKFIFWFVEKDECLCSTKFAYLSNRKLQMSYL